MKENNSDFCSRFFAFKARFLEFQFQEERENPVFGIRFPNFNSVFSLLVSTFFLLEAPSCFWRVFFRFADKIQAATALVLFHGLNIRCLRESFALKMQNWLLGTILTSSSFEVLSIGNVPSEMNSSLPGNGRCIIQSLLSSHAYVCTVRSRVKSQINFSPQSRRTNGHLFDCVPTVHSAERTARSLSELKPIFEVGTIWGKWALVAAWTS